MDDLVYHSLAQRRVGCFGLTQLADLAFRRGISFGQLMASEFARVTGIQRYTSPHLSASRGHVARNFKLYGLRGFRDVTDGCGGFCFSASISPEATSASQWLLFGTCPGRTVSRFDTRGFSLHPLLANYEFFFPLRARAPRARDTAMILV